MNEMFELEEMCIRDRYMPEEDDKNPLGWTRDRVLTDEILKCLDSTEDQPDYVYTISVQGHGAYPEEPELAVSYTHLIAEGEQKIEDARKEISEIEEPEWIVTDRNDLPEMCIRDRYYIWLWLMVL